MLHALSIAMLRKHTDILNTKSSAAHHASARRLVPPATCNLHMPSRHAPGDQPRVRASEPLATASSSAAAALTALTAANGAVPAADVPAATSAARALAAALAPI